MAGKMGEGEALVEDIMQTVATEHPITEWDLSIEIDVTFEAGIIVYAVRVENRTNKVIRKITISPDIDEEIFAIEERAKTLGPLPSNSAQSAIFRIRPQKKSWDFGVTGGVIAGRDVSMKALLRTSGGEVKYELTVENTQRHSIRFLKVKPVLPRNFVALEKEKTINILEAGERKTVTFELMSRVEWEEQQRHEESLRRPWKFASEKPRRKKKGYPRSYTREEMAEIKRFLLFTEADEELLNLIGEKGIEEETVEIGLIFAYRDIIEEDAIEEDFALRRFLIGEPIEEDLVELPQDYKRVIKLNVIEEDPLEFDFDIDELKDVRPLDLTGAQTEDIELEPMEMDI
jgi:hypothetical protein